MDNVAGEGRDVKMNNTVCKLIYYRIFYQLEIWKKTQFDLTKKFHNIMTVKGLVYYKSLRELYNFFAFLLRRKEEIDRNMLLDFNNVICCWA